MHLDSNRANVCVFPALVEDLVKTSGRTLSQPQGVRWGLWETWSSCSQQCSRGFRTRKRSCSTAEGWTNPSACVGSPVEYQDCNTQPCPGNKEVLTVHVVAIVEYVHYINKVLYVCVFQWVEPGLAGPPGPSVRPVVGADTTSGLGRAAAHHLPMEETSV